MRMPQTSRSPRRKSKGSSPNTLEDVSTTESDSPIPNVNGYRKDLVEAIRNLKVPVLRWQEAALPMNITGETESVR